MTDTAIIGGTGFEQLSGFQIERRAVISTPYGDPSSALVFGRLSELELVFLSRHGVGHRIPPHQINYRANIWALKEIGVKQIIAFAAVGGITKFTPGAIVIPDQITDYTWGRAHTFFDNQPADELGLDKQRFDEQVFARSNVSMHIDFSKPYSEAVREKIIVAAKKSRVKLNVGATYAATQGPRLETSAEIDRLERDGASIVGMTGMPEAALARELDIEYAAIAIVVNFAAGRGEEDVSMENIEKELKAGAKKVMKIIANL